MMSVIFSVIFSVLSSLHHYWLHVSHQWSVNYLHFKFGGNLVDFLLTLCAIQIYLLTYLCGTCLCIWHLHDCSRRDKANGVEIKKLNRQIQGINSAYHNYCIFD